MTFNKILEKYRKISFSEADKGQRFERLMKAYLQTDPIYSNLFTKIWLWNEFPYRKDFGGNDTGIDLVAKTSENDYWAIQCKCFQENAVIDKPAVDTFLSTSSKVFQDDNKKKVAFSNRLWISTTNKWNSNATLAIQNQNPPLTRLNLNDLQVASVDWEKIEKGISGEDSRIQKKTLKLHQNEAVEKAHLYFKKYDRGKLIMACGTGKTFVSLKIVEKETKGKGLILFFVPSIALMSQILREWSEEASKPINAICICSDPEVSRKKSKMDEIDSYSSVDLALPATTNAKDIVKQLKKIKPSQMNVVFSTYQSIDVISKAQKTMMKGKNGFREFDLIVCDEAHRTTGVALTDEDSSAFIRVHDDKYIKAKKRLYMTATPRLYSDDAKSKAAQAEAILCSMDDTSMYGEEIYRIGFGESVERNLLTDYKVLILTLNENDVPPAIQKMITDKESEINTDDASKLIGCINALSKQILGDDGVIKESDPEPMKRAVAFCQKIVISKKITETFNTATDIYIDSLPQDKKDKMVNVSSKHIDGTMSAPERNDLLSWLKEDQKGECRILTNVRCLSEGVDVPSLDAVMFLSARNSQIDVVQSVGRVMRKSPGKNYGYIIIPVLVPSNVEPEIALNDNERYKVVWMVLNALRAHDDRFNATVNKIELNKKRPKQILIGRTEYTFDDDGEPVLSVRDSERSKYDSKINEQLYLQFEKLQSVIFARMVQKVGDRRYWEQWAKSVAEIAEKQIERIGNLIKKQGSHRQAFENFLAGLQKNINPSITGQEAIEMLSQHIITKPVFEALFEGYTFVKSNAISISMQKMLDLLEAQALEKDTAMLDKFYESVRKRASGIDNAEGRQRIIIELYDKFFKTAFPKMVERLGIVYTPVELVDFIINSVNDVLKKEFGRSLSDENIHILDPFTGTGTFITRLLQSGLIDKKDLKRKYTKELHANEIVLLAYYIATVNIENAYHDATPDPNDGIGKENYTPFDGIVLTDTFQLGETPESEQLFSEMFPQNSERVAAQKKAPIRVIIGNPPYSVGQRSANDNAQNQPYLKLDKRISVTYAKETSATNKNSLYDSYIKAFRWASDRLEKENGGIICFVSNGAWIDGNAQDGFRKCLEREFSSIYVFNTRGNARTQGELRRKEAGNVFGGGSRTPISITLLVQNPGIKQEKATIHYYDIGDYLNREEKLSIVNDFQSVSNPEIKWKTLKPNKYGDWISQRKKAFENFITLGDKNNLSKNTFFLPYYSRGLASCRDAWCYNFLKSNIKNNITKTIDYFNIERDKYSKEIKKNSQLNINDFLSYDSTKISWNRQFKDLVKRNYKITFNKENIYCGIYRPFVKQFVYFSNVLKRV
ncbi:DEAD/DEAH box helicase [candidate division WOR-3 bacterium]|nr:DEAD/DEAH box helicase [candidate division WOR-3 bacterium]